MSEQNNTWRCPALPLMLGAGEVHVWRIDLDDRRHDRHALQATLSQDELARAGRFVFPHDRDRYVTGRGIVRVILALYTGIAPGALRFGYGSHGKPFLTQPAGALQFNLSHSRHLALLAITREWRVGVDIEYMREALEYEPIAADLFSEAEQAALHATPAVQRRAAFFACWTRKEACVKAHGAGLSLPLAEFDVSVQPDGPAAILRISTPYAGAAWSLHTLHPAHQYAAAFAIEGQRPLLRLYDLPPELVSHSAPLAPVSPLTQR